MYKGFFEDMEYVMGLFFKPFEDCFGEAEDRDEEDEDEHGMRCCLVPPCMRERKDEDEDEAEAEEKGGMGIFGEGPLQDIMKCMFDASDIDYDYED